MSLLNEVSDGIREPCYRICVHGAAVRVMIMHKIQWAHYGTILTLLIIDQFWKKCPLHLFFLRYPRALKKHAHIPNSVISHAHVLCH